MKVPVYQRRPGLDTRLVDQDTFIITPTTIQHLNAAAAVVWLILEEPATRREALALMRGVYPHVAWQRLSADLGKLLQSLGEMKLIETVKTPRASPVSPAAARAPRRARAPARGRRPAPGR